MQPELALKAISYTVIGIFLVTILLILLISLRKELSGEAPLRGVFQFGFVIIGFCTVVALMAEFFQARKMVLPIMTARSSLELKQMLYRLNRAQHLDFESSAPSLHATN